MKRKYLIFICCLILIVATGCYKSADVAPVAPPVPEVKAEPYKFGLGQMEFSPADAAVNSPVAVGIPLKNMGSEANTYVETLIVDGNPYETKDIFLKPGEIGALNFNMKFDKAGTYKVACGPVEAMIRVYFKEKLAVYCTNSYDPTYPTTEKDFASGIRRFSLPVKSYVITGISYHFQSFPKTISIYDTLNKLLFSKEITSSAVDFPEIEVNSDFYIKISPSRPDRVTGYGPTSTGWRGNGIGWGEYSYGVWPEVYSVSGFVKRYNP